MGAADQARSIFLAALMIGSVILGALVFDLDGSKENLSPIIDGNIPNQILIGSTDSIELSISDEDMPSLSLTITMDGQSLEVVPDENGKLIFDISELSVGEHSLKIIALDSVGQESRWTSVFTIHYPAENPTVMVVDNNEINLVRGDSATINGTLIHPNLDSCELGWSDSDVNEFSLNLPFSDSGKFLWGPAEIESNITISILATCGTWEDSSALEMVYLNVTEPVRGCTDSEANNFNSTATEDDGSCEYDEETVAGCTDESANNFDSAATQDDGSCEYDDDPAPETGSSAWWSETLLCDEEQVPVVDDYSTEEPDNHMCDLSFVIEDQNITISTNGLPNHDFESTIGCCATAQSMSYTIPLTPTDDPNCNPTVSSDGCVMAAIRGSIAFTVTGVAIYGPEDGPGGDAVALEEGAYEQEDGEQPVDLGVCHGHSGPGGEYHYHADANCIHWHAAEGETMYDYNLDSQRTLNTHSKIVGFAFDGNSIYGFTGWNEDGEVVEMTSSYRLKDGADGSGGIDDYEYIQGLGTLDACNGIFSATPDWPEGIYHYHTTMINGEGGIGFPYFINCYGGELPSDDGDGEDPDCSGHGETWGPGIGPPPPGCEGGPPPGGDQSIEKGIFSVPWLKSLPPNSGMILLSMLVMASVTRFAFKGSAFYSSAQGQVGRVHEYHSVLARA